MFHGQKKASDLSPYEYDSFVKHYFLKFGIKPSEVDKMDHHQVNDLMEMRILEGEKEKFKEMESNTKGKLRQWLNNQQRK